MSRGRVVVVGAGPGGMAAALAAHRLGFEVRIFERHREAKPAWNILNLWPPPQKVLQLLGVDTDELGAPGRSVFANHRGRVRADLRLPDEVVAQYGGGFIGLLRPGLYERMLRALPAGVLSVDHHGNQWLRPGDVVEGEITGLGRQRNLCVAPPADDAWRRAGSLAQPSLPIPLQAPGGSDD